MASARVCRDLIESASRVSKPSLTFGARPSAPKRHAKAHLRFFNVDAAHQSSRVDLCFVIEMFEVAQEEVLLTRT